MGGDLVPDADVQAVTEGAAKLTIGAGVIRLASLSAVVTTLLLAVPAASADGSHSGAAGVPSPSAVPSAAAHPRVAAPEHCSDARRGLAFYIRAVNASRAELGQPKVDAKPWRPKASCKWIRFLAKRWRARAHEARVELKAWRDEWNWQAWLPAKWYRIARCETGVRWDWNSGAYQGAFGFAVSSWDSFRLEGYPSEAYLATPRQQYEVALAIWRRFGFSGWGCRNA